MTNTTYWVPKLSPKQMEVFDDLHRFLLLDGPRKSGKTLAACHKILRHCFDTPNARVAMFCKTTKNAKAGGVWLDITQLALPEWEAANIGMKLTDGPAVTGDTRMSFFKVSNRYGGESEVQLHSLEYCPDIVEKIRGARFSMVYFSELDNFDDRIVFDISEDQLRMLNLPYEMHQWLADTNPPPSGTNNWMHDLWFKEKEQENHEDPEYQAQIHRIPFTIDDNPFLDEREKRNLIAKYRKRKSLYDRFILGKWEEDLTDGCFSEVFRPETHVLGNIQYPTRAEWEVITPTESCQELLIGLDPGDVNHSAHIVEQINTPNGEPIFAVIDEIVSVGRNISLREFSNAIITQMDFWENYCRTNYNRAIKWKTWADTSVDRYRSAAAADEALVIRNLSNGRIRPRAAAKFSGSVETRVRILHRLFSENRIFISASCPDTITMCKALKRTNVKAEPIGPRKHKHPFDSLTYILISEEPMALEQSAPRVGRGTHKPVVLIGA
jgi:hypothetical protein